MSIQLRTLKESDESAFLEGYQLAGSDAEDWYTFSWRPGIPYKDHLNLLLKEAAGEDLAPGRVPHSMLYGFLNGQIVGRVSIRHELNANLVRRGGNLGYWVAKEFRGRGYASQMMQEALGFCHRIGLKTLLITCADNNLPSCKIIEKFGGQLENKILDDEDGELICRYWLKIK